MISYQIHPLRYHVNLSKVTDSGYQPKYPYDSPEIHPQIPYESTPKLPTWSIRKGIPMISYQIHPLRYRMNHAQSYQFGVSARHPCDFPSNSPPQIPYESPPELPIRDIRIGIPKISYQIQPLRYRMNHHQSYRFGVSA